MSPCVFPCFHMLPYAPQWFPMFPCVVNGFLGFSMVSYVPLCVYNVVPMFRLVPYVSLWLPKFPCVVLCLPMFSQAPLGHLRFPCVFLCSPMCYHVVLSCLKCSYGFILFPMVSYGSLFLPMCSDVLFLCVSMCSQVPLCFLIFFRVLPCVFSGCHLLSYVPDAFPSVPMLSYVVLCFLLFSVVPFPCGCQSFHMLS